MTSRPFTAAPILAALAMVLLICAAIRFRPQRPYSEIVDKLPQSANLVRHELIWHGFDPCHVFEFSCADAALRDELVSRWQLRDLTDSADGPVTFLENTHPTWWTPDVPAAIRRFGRHDDDSESYLSVWEHSDTGRLYVEVGRW
jgi:hypothetical protein